MAVRALVVSDTHLRAGARLPIGLARAAEDVDVILHAGDVLVEGVFEQFRAFAPVHAVLGNNDHDFVGELPERLEVELGGVSVALVHDSGAAPGRAYRLHRWFPAANLVIFGHSHQPLDETGSDGQRLFNPGSPTERRRAPRHTYGVIEFDAGAVLSSRIVPLD